MSAEKRKKRPRGRPPEHEEVFLPATFKEILQRVVQTRTPEEIEAIMEEERKKNDGRTQQTDTDSQDR